MDQNKIEGGRQRYRNRVALSERLREGPEIEPLHRAFAEALPEPDPAHL